MDKRGDTELIPWIIRFLFLGLFILGLVMIHFNVNKRLLQADDIVFYPILDRILFSPSCFVYFDEDLGKARPGFFDYDSLTNEDFDRCFNNEDLKLAIKTTVNTGQEEFVFYHREELFEEYKVIAPLSPNIYLRQRTLPVFVVKEGSAEPAKVALEVAWFQN